MDRSFTLGDFFAGSKALLPERPTVAFQVVQVLEHFPVEV
jgi:hypothetical protein